MALFPRVRYLLRGHRLLILLVLLALTLPALTAARTYTAEVALFFPERRPVGTPLAGAEIPGIHEVELSYGEDKLGAWYAPGGNGASIVLCHGAGGDRAQLLPEARALAQEGFGILMFDWPGHGTSTGPVTWHDRERRSLVAALDWLAERSGADPKRLGAIGFSLGGYILSQVARTDRRLRALALLGTPSNLNDQVRLSHQAYSAVREPAARWALELHGIDLDEPQPEHVIGHFSGALLVVGGTADVTVPLELTRNLFHAAKPPKVLYAVPNGSHGNYVQTAGDEYLTRLTGHFRTALLAR
jgi:pimeloyl-ACP methyl ester carboxylesterase